MQAPSASRIGSAPPAKDASASPCSSRAGKGPSRLASAGAGSCVCAATSTRLLKRRPRQTAASAATAVDVKALRAVAVEQ